MMSDTKQAVVCAMMRVNPQLSAPADAVREAIAFLELEGKVDPGAVLHRVRALVHGPVTAGIWAQLNDLPMEHPTKLNRLGSDLARFGCGEHEGLAPWVADIELLFESWLNAEPDIVAAMYGTARVAA